MSGARQCFGRIALALTSDFLLRNVWARRRLGSIGSSDVKRLLKTNLGFFSMVAGELSPTHATVTTDATQTAH